MACAAEPSAITLSVGALPSLERSRTIITHVTGSALAGIVRVASSHVRYWKYAARTRRRGRKSKIAQFFTKIAGFLAISGDLFLRNDRVGGFVDVSRNRSLEVMRKKTRKKGEIKKRIPSV